MQPDICQRAIGHWPSILRALDVEDRFLHNRHGPCPMCGGRDRFRFDDKEGRGTWFCSHCGAGDGFALLMRLRDVSFSQAARLVREVMGTLPAPLPTVRKRANDRAYAAQIWSEGYPLRSGDPVDQYLRGRGLVLDEYPGVLRFHPRLPYFTNGKKRGCFPAMLALVTDAQGQQVGIHRTYLRDGQKAPVEAPKKLLGNGGAVRLFAPPGILAVTEGIETALAVHASYGVPAWAALSANGLRAFQWPAGVALKVYGDNDFSLTGQEAAYHLAHRARAAGLVVGVSIPETPGEDWADVRLRTAPLCRG